MYAIRSYYALLLQVTQPVSLEYDEPDIPQTANAGDTLPLSFSVFNKGRSKLYNVMVKIDAPGLLPEGSAFVGNMEPGTSGTAELYVFVGTLAMSQGEEGNIQTDKDTVITSYSIHYTKLYDIAHSTASGHTRSCACDQLSQPPTRACGRCHASTP